MPSVLHLLKRDSPPLAVPVIAAQCREPDTRVTVVLLDAAPEPALPAPARLHRLAPGDLDHSGLLDLIFTSDRVVAW